MNKQPEKRSINNVTFRKQLLLVTIPVVLSVILGNLILLTITRHFEIKRREFETKRDVAQKIISETSKHYNLLIGNLYNKRMILKRLDQLGKKGAKSDNLFTDPPLMEYMKRSDDYHWRRMELMSQDEIMFLVSTYFCREIKEQWKSIQEKQSFVIEYINIMAKEMAMTDGIIPNVPDEEKLNKLKSSLGNEIRIGVKMIIDELSTE